MELDELYTQVITENSRSKEHRYQMQAPSVVKEGVNPSCGDEITLQLELDGDVIKDAAFIGDGCAISQASANIMIDLILGKTVEEAKALSGTFMGMIKGEVTDEDSIESLEDAQAFQGISHMPSRVKCAVLGWHTLEEALKGKDGNT